MKRTTYILIGLLISGLIVIVASIITISLIGKEDTLDKIYLSDENARLRLGRVHTVKVLVNQGEPDKRILTSGMIAVTSAPVGKGNISYPKSECFKVRQKEDTLLIEVDLSVYATAERYKNSHFLVVDDLRINLAVDSTLKCIVAGGANGALHFKGIQSDSLLIRAYNQRVELDSCQFRSFDLGGAQFSFSGVNSKIKNYYLDLNGVENWTFQNTEVDTEYLSGSGQHTNNLGKGECQRVVWRPYTQDATLQITLHEGAEVNVAH